MVVAFSGQALRVALWIQEFPDCGEPTHDHAARVGAAAQGAKCEHPISYPGMGLLKAAAGQLIHPVLAKEPVHIKVQITRARHRRAPTRRGRR